MPLYIFEESYGIREILPPSGGLVGAGLEAVGGRGHAGEGGGEHVHAATMAPRP